MWYNVLIIPQEEIDTSRVHIQEPPQSYRCQKSEMKQLPTREPINIRPHHRKM
jgi:hypothetical protein